MEYLIGGTGEPLVLIHGFCETGSIWRKISPELESHFQVILPDLPGFGNSAYQQGSYTMEYYAEALIQLLNQERILEAHLVGHSMGGYICLALAEAYPDRFARITLLHSTAEEDSEQRKINRNRTIDFLEKKGLELFASSFVPPLFRVETRAHFASDIKTIQEELKQSTQDALIKVTASMRDRPNRVHLLKEHRERFQVIAGKLDTALPLNSIERQTQNVVPLHVLDGCGHMGMLEAPNEVAGLILKFHAPERIA
ncbi:MAG: alpha/beta hydrolase [Cytophagaceae bacterium]|jgi:pimeloyl-ACP methyl ester carboxylesterase|nr:alpha/beta hydrolase [Cytophagaceae bacterium]